VQHEKGVFSIFGRSVVKGRLVIITVSAVLLLVSLIGVIAASALPTEVKQETALLNYEHKGSFDYLVHLKPSYLFGPEPEKPSPPPPQASSPKYPADIIDKFLMTFAYRFVPDKPVTRTYETVEVKAIVKSPGVEDKELVLLPKLPETEAFTAGFPFRMSEVPSGSDVTITAYVYTTVETDAGPIFEAFTQSLAIRSKGPLLEVDKDLSRVEPGYTGGLIYKQQGEFDYKVQLRSDSPFGAITLKPPSVTPPPEPPPPPPPPPPPLKTLERGQTVFTKLVDSMDVTFNYSFMSEKPVSAVTTDVEITAVLEATKLWSKQFPILYASKGGNFSVTFPLDLVSYLELFEAIRTETGASAESYNLTVTADVHTVADTQFGLVNETFSQAMKGTLKGNVLEWDKELAQSKPGSIKTTKVIPNPNSYLGLSVAEARILSTALAGIFFVFLLFQGVMYVRFKPAEVSQAEKAVRQARKKYGAFIVEATIDGEKTVSVDSMEDLIKVANELGKPIVHQAPRASEEPHAYYVLDGATRYQYVLAMGGKMFRLGKS
jgi:hypothetical protein